MYTSRQNFRRVGHEPIGWRDGIGSRGDIRQRSYTPGGDDDAVRFVGGHSCSRKPSTFHEVFYDFRTELEDMHYRGDRIDSYHLEDLLRRSNQLYHYYATHPQAHGTGLRKKKGKKY